MNNNAYVFGQRKEGAKENVLSRERLEQIKQNAKFIRSAPVDTLKPACPQCINLLECLAHAKDSLIGGDRNNALRNALQYLFGKGRPQSCDLWKL